MWDLKLTIKFITCRFRSIGEQMIPLSFSLRFLNLKSKI
jgi:hypothetical protein